MEWDSPKTRAIQLAFIGSRAQTRLSTHDPDLTQLQAFEHKQRRIEGRVTTQNDNLRRDKRATSDMKMKRVTSDNHLGYEDVTTSGKGKIATLDNLLGHEDEENDVIRRTSPKALHKNLDGFRDQSGRNS